MAVVKKDPYAGAVTKPETERGGAAKDSVKQPASTSAKVQQPAPAQSPAAASPSTGPSMEGTTFSKAPVQALGGYIYDVERPSYSSPYSRQIDDLLEAVMSREAFSYDLESDPLYDQYHKQAVREGDRAMRDAMGNAAALTGGYGSSYATTAGSQAYDYYLSRLNDRIPELEQLAYSKYLQEGQDLYNQLAALQGMEDRAYDRYLGELDAWESDRAFDYGIWSDALDQQNWETSFDYQKAQDALAQQNWERELAYQQEQDALAYALKLAQLQEEENTIPNPVVETTANLKAVESQMSSALYQAQRLEGATGQEMARVFEDIINAYEKNGYTFADSDVLELARKYGLRDELGL